MAGHDAKMFLTGPAVVERVTREQVTALELGGPKVHGRNGIAHLFAEHDVHAADWCRRSRTWPEAGGGLPLYPPADPAPGDPGEVLPAREREVYDVRDVAARLIDDGEFLEFGPRWARNLVVGFAASRARRSASSPTRPTHLGGCLDAESSQKGAWFVDLCDRFGLPLVVLVDTPGFLPGVSQEQAGVIRHGASLLRAFSVATTPRITVTLRAAYGGAHIVMNSRDLGAHLTMAWPHAKIGVMGPRQAVEIVNRREIAAGADADALSNTCAAEHLPVRVAASRGFFTSTRSSQPARRATRPPAPAGARRGRRRTGRRRRHRHRVAAVDDLEAPSGPMTPNLEHEARPPVKSAPRSRESMTMCAPP